MKSESEFMHHEPCPECGSSDALGRYTDGHGYCHKCEHWEPGEGTESASPQRQRKGSSMDKLLTGTVQAHGGVFRRRAGEGCGSGHRGSWGLLRAFAPLE